MAVIESIQIGKIVSEGDPASRDVISRQWTSAFRKTRVDGEVTVGALGIIGDQVADTVNHGGTHKAVLCYAAVHYPNWKLDHPELDFGPGGFGENLTLGDLTETGVCIGDRWRSSQCEFEVSQPRQPCWKIARRWQTKSLTKEVAQTGRTGWYVRVIVGGNLREGESLQLIRRPNPSWSVARANDVLYRRESDTNAAAELASLDTLSTEWKEALG